MAESSGDDGLMARAVRDEAAALAVLDDYDTACQRLSEAQGLAARAGHLSLQAPME